MAARKICLDFIQVSKVTEIYHIRLQYAHTIRYEFPNAARNQRFIVRSPNSARMWAAWRRASLGYGMTLEIEIQGMAPGSTVKSSKEDPKSVMTLKPPRQEGHGVHIT